MYMLLDLFNMLMAISHLLQRHKEVEITGSYIQTTKWILKNFSAHILKNIHTLLCCFWVPFLY